MKTIKIIDLAEKQKNNEILPKHIRYENEDLYFDGVTYYDKEGNNDFFDILAMNNGALTHLYDEVEIIEEKPKHIEELEILGFRNLNNYEKLEVERLKNKINELIKTMNYLLDKEEK